MLSFHKNDAEFPSRMFNIGFCGFPVIGVLLGVDLDLEHRFIFRASFVALYWPSLINMKFVTVSTFTPARAR